jgi:hypothetical protein
VLLRIQIFGLRRCVFCWMIRDISKDCSAVQEEFFLALLNPLRWRHYDRSKRQLPFTQRHSVPCNKTWILKFAVFHRILVPEFCRACEYDKGTWRVRLTFWLLHDKELLNKSVRDIHHILLLRGAKEGECDLRDIEIEKHIIFQKEYPKRRDCLGDCCAVYIEG